MSEWRYTVKLGDVWRSDAMTFEQRRDAIVERLRSSGWASRSANRSELLDIIDDLEHSVDAENFDYAWGALYDLADYDRAWIDTHSPVRAS
jgi:hypothetical protein